MDQVLRLNNTDQRISYTTDWKIIPNSGVGQNGSYSLTNSSEASISFLFRGTSLRFYGRLSGGGGNLQFRLDANDANTVLNGTNFNDGPTLIWSADNLGDGDHQLYVHVISLQQNGSVAVDYLEVENSSGKGFDLLWAGPNATNVPKEAIIVDSSNPDIVLSNASQWTIGDGVDFYRQSALVTTQAGASLDFSFDGVAIWYYSDIDTGHGFYTISIDGSDPEQLNGRNDGGHLTQQMLWSKTDLTPGRHTFTLRQYDIGGKYTTLDFFRVLHADDASALPSSIPTSTGATTPESKSNTLPLAVGLTLGLLLPALAVLGTFYLRRRKRRDLDRRRRRKATPPHPTPPEKDDQLSGAPQESKNHPQPTQPPTHGSTLSSSAPSAPAVPTTSYP